MEYGMVLIIWMADHAVLANAVGSSCDSILQELSILLDHTHRFQVLACELTRGA